MSFLDSKPKTRLIIPDYVVPTDKKREAVRFAIRMKMFLASGIEFPNPLDGIEKKRKANKNIKITDKPTNMGIKELNAEI